MVSYRVRAEAINDLTAELRCELERHVASTPSDKMLLIDLSVEVINKLLYCFMLSPDMFERIDDLLNQHLTVQADPQEIAALYLRVLGVVRQLEANTHRWVVHYRGTKG